MSDREKTISSYIANWVRWQNTGVSPVPFPPTSCGSAEKNTLSPPGALQDETLHIKTPVIVEHAQRVHVIHQSLPTIQMRLIICGRYVQSRESGWGEKGAAALCAWVLRQTRRPCTASDITAATACFRRAVAREFEI